MESKEPKHWMELLDTRQRKEVEFARNYKANFAHGTTGHNQLLLVAQLAEFIDELYGRLSGEE